MTGLLISFTIAYLFCVVALLVLPLDREVKNHLGFLLIGFLLGFAAGIFAYALIP